MPHIMVTAWYPMYPAKAAEVAKKTYDAVKKFPADESIATLLAQGFMGSKVGIKVITIWNVKEGKLEEALTRIGEMMRFYAEVEGFTYKTELMVTPEEAWATVGMTPPE